MHVEKAPANWQSPEKLLSGLTGAQVDWSLKATLQSSALELQLLDRESSAQIRALALPSPTEGGETRGRAATLDLDFHQKLLLKFSLSVLVDKKQPKQLPFAPHQLFARFLHANESVGTVREFSFVGLSSHSSSTALLLSFFTGQDVYFVVEPESASEKTKKGKEAPAPASTTATAYRFDLDLFQKADEFDHQDGQYSLQLIVGDALLEESGFTWQLVDFNLHFPKSGDVKSSKLVTAAAADAPGHLLTSNARMQMVFVLAACS